MGSLAFPNGEGFGVRAHMVEWGAHDAPIGTRDEPGGTLWHGFAFRIGIDDFSFPWYSESGEKEGSDLNMRKITVFLCLVCLLAVLAVPGSAADTGMPWSATPLGPEDYSAYFPDCLWVPIYVYAEEGWYPLSVQPDSEGSDVPMSDLKPLGDNWYQGLVLRDTTSVRFDGTDGENTTVTLSVEPGVPIWFVINTGWDVEVSYEPLTDHLSYYTVYVQPPESWDGVNIWAWDTFHNVNAFSGWPGPEMAYDPAQIQAYTFRVPGWVDGMSFSTADGTIQSENIYPDGCDKWVRITDDPDGEGFAHCQVGNYVPADYQPAENAAPTEEPVNTPKDNTETKAMTKALILGGSVILGIITIIAAWIKQKKS